MKVWRATSLADGSDSRNLADYEIGENHETEDDLKGLSLSESGVT